MSLLNRKLGWKVFFNLLSFSLVSLILNYSCVFKIHAVELKENENSINFVSSDENQTKESFKNFVSGNEFYDRFIKNFDYLDPNDETNLEKDAITLQKNLIEFLDNSKNDVPDEGFLDYISEYIKNKQKSGSELIKVISAAEFEKLKKNPDYIIVYRGVPQKKYVESYREGEVYVGGRKNKSRWLCVPSGIYTSGERESAEGYAYSREEIRNEKGEKYLTRKLTGGLLAFALNKNAKYVHSKYIEKVVNKMMEKFKQNSNNVKCIWYDNYLKFLHDILGGHDTYATIMLDFSTATRKASEGSDSYFCTSLWNYNAKYVIDFVKEKTKFDYFDFEKNPDPIQRNKILAEKFFDLCGMGFSISDDGTYWQGTRHPNFEFKPLSDEQKRNRQEFEKFWKKNDADNQNWVVDRFKCVLGNEGLIAKLMGYDIVGNWLTEEKYNQMFGENLKHIGVLSEFLIVDWSNVAVFVEDLK